MTMVEMIDAPVEFERFIPNWETLFLSLHRTPAGTLTELSTAIGWALQALQAEKQPLAEMERVLKESLLGLEGLSDEQLGQWKRVFWYLFLLVFHRRSAEESPELMNMIREQARQSKFHSQEEVQSMEMTYAEFLEKEYIRKHGHEIEQMVRDSVIESVRDSVRQEVQQEVQQSLRSTLETLLLGRFGTIPPAKLAVIAAADLDSLNDWLRIAANAPDLQSVGISDLS